MLLPIWDIFKMVKQFCSQRWSLQRRIVASRSRGCVHHSQARVQRLWSLCSRAKSIKSSNRKISNCHWDYKSQITMHWDWDFVTHLKWGIWNFRISTSLSLKNMQYALAVSYFPKSQEWPISWWAPVDRKYSLDGWDLAVCASWGGLSVLNGYYIDAFRMINQVSSLIVLFNVVSHYYNLR